MKIAIVSSHTESLFWFRKDFMKDLQKKENSVIAFGPGVYSEWHEKFSEIGVSYEEFFVKRNSINPINDIKTCISLYRKLKHSKVDRVFLYNAKSVIYGSVVSKLLGISQVTVLVAGMGSVIRGKGFKNKLLKFIMFIQYKIALSISQSVFVHNRDDYNLIINKFRIKKNKVKIINGSGVNINEFNFTCNSFDEFSFLFIGRLLKDKGIQEYLLACKDLKDEYNDIIFNIVGPFDSNPSSIDYNIFEEYIKSGIIVYHGYQENVKVFIDDCNVFVLPSYHEGKPKTILEAMSKGRAIITTNAPGCKEVVDDNYNGLKVNVGDYRDLYEKMKFLYKNQQLVLEMGKNSRNLVEELYDVNIVNKEMIDFMYQSSTGGEKNE